MVFILPTFGVDITYVIIKGNVIRLYKNRKLDTKLNHNIINVPENNLLKYNIYNICMVNMRMKK